MAITPVNFPDGSPINYQAGQVRHFSREDGLGAEALSRPTRELAYRDSVLRDKINEVVDTVNNKEQYLSVPLPRVLVPSGTSECLANFNIPSGFEARVFNTKLYGADGIFSVQYSSSTFGATSGTVLSSITSGTEGSSGTFYSGGELIFVITNNGTTAEFVASAVLTLRPIGDIDGSLVESVVTIGQSLPGPQGEKGDTGTGTPGPAGTSFIWKGSYNLSTTYTLNDTVAYATPGTGTSTYVYTNAADGAGHAPPAPGATNAYWEMMAEGALSGSQGVTGATGATGPVGISYEGAWSTSNDTTSDADYVLNDVVTWKSGSISRSYINIGSIAAGGTIPAYDAVHWAELFGPSMQPSFGSVATYLALAASTGYVAGTENNGYVAGTLPVNIIAFENVIYSQPSGGMAFLTNSSRACSFNFKGRVKITLPTSGTQAVWDNQNANIIAVPHGTHVSAGGTTNLINVWPGSGAENNAWYVEVLSPDPVNVKLSVIGITPL